MMQLRSGIDWSARTYEEVRARHAWHVPPRLNIARAVCDVHANGAGKVALVSAGAEHEKTTYTFDELKDLSDRLATVLRGLGVDRGDKVAVYLPQRVECALAHLAAFKLGAVSVPLSPLFRADALAYRLTHSRAKVVVTDAEHRAFLPAGSARVLDCDAGAPGPGVESFWSLVREAGPTAAADTSADDPAMVVYTSGTTGLPKGALHAHRFLPGRLSGFELMHGLEARPSGDRPFWTPADWAWVGGLVDCVLTPWAFGCPVLAWSRRRFEPAVVLDLIASMRVRSLFLPPTAIQRMRAEVPAGRRVDVVSVHTAGEPLSREAYTWAAATFGTVYELYGMTEMGATIGNSPFFPVRPGSMGKPFPGHHVVLAREDGTPAEDGEIGEIAIRRGDPGMFLGYLDDPDATAARFRGEWLLTGDLALRDEDGYFHYRGRADDVFNTAGYRVGPTEIEQSLLSHPAVEHAAVVGAPDPERGEIVKAFVVVRTGFAPGSDLRADIQRHVKERLAAYEYPRQIVFARELPVTTTGKVRRAELRAPGADARYGLGRET
jgi:acetyl-CoA synthetase